MKEREMEYSGAKGLEWMYTCFKNPDGPEQNWVLIMRTVGEEFEWLE